MKNLFNSLGKKIFLVLFALISFTICIAATRAAEAYILFGNDHYVLYINQNTCIGCGACTRADPAFYLDEDGLVWVKASELTPEGCEDAINACPSSGTLMMTTSSR